MNFNKKIKKLIVFFLAIISIFSLTACSNKTAIKIKYEDSPDFEELCDEMFLRVIDSDPLNIYYLYKNKANHTFSEDQLCLRFYDEVNDNESLKYSKEMKDKFKKINRSLLTEKQQLSYDAILWQFDNIDYMDYPIYIKPIFDPNNGIIPDISFYFVEFPVETEDDARDYLTFLKSVPDFTNEIIEFANQQAAKGYAPSDLIYEKNIDTCQTILDSKSNPFIECFNEKIDALNISSASKDQLKQLNKNYYETYVAKAYGDLISAFKSLLGSCKNERGLYGYGDDGQKYYSLLVKNNTSSALSTKEVYKYLENKVNALFYAYYSIIVKDPEVIDKLDTMDWGFESPDEILNDVINTMNNEFSVPQFTDYVLTPINKSCEIDGVLAYYMKPRLDDMNTNRIRINMSNFDTTDIMSYITIVHEGMPGHMYQYTEFLGNDDFPNYHKIMSFLGETEGWAEYAAYESLNGYVQRKNVDKNVADLMIYYNRFAYCLEALIDMSINYKGYTVDDLVNQFGKYGVSEASAKQYYNRAICSPGTLLPYAFGCEKMYDLQSKVIDELGESYIKAFNQKVIETGIVPFPVLEKQIDKWIEEQK